MKFFTLTLSLILCSSHLLAVGPQKRTPVSNVKPTADTVLFGFEATATENKLFNEAVPLEGHRLARRLNAQTFNGDPMDLRGEPAYAEFFSGYKQAGNEFQRARMVASIQERIRAEHATLLGYRTIRCTIPGIRFGEYDFHRQVFHMPVLDPWFDRQVCPFPNNLLDLLLPSPMIKGEETTWGYRGTIPVPPEQAERFVTEFPSRICNITFVFDNQSFSWRNNPLNQPRWLSGKALVARIDFHGSTAGSGRPPRVAYFPNAKTANQALLFAVAKAAFVMDEVDRPLDTTVDAKINNYGFPKFETTDFVKRIESLRSFYADSGIILDDETNKIADETIKRRMARIDLLWKLVSNGIVKHGSAGTSGSSGRVRKEVSIHVENVDRSANEITGYAMIDKTVMGLNPRQTTRNPFKGWVEVNHFGPVLHLDFDTPDAPKRYSMLLRNGNLFVGSTTSVTTVFFKDEK